MPKAGPAPRVNLVKYKGKQEGIHQNLQKTEKSKFSENFAAGPKSLREANTLFPNSFWIVITRFLGRIIHIHFG